jgi:tellurite resistance protein TehA-like permease
MPYVTVAPPANLVSPGSQQLGSAWVPVKVATQYEITQYFITVVIVVVTLLLLAAVENLFYGPLGFDKKSASDSFVVFGIVGVVLLCLIAVAMTVERKYRFAPLIFPSSVNITYPEAG